MNEIINKFLLAVDKFMPEIHLKLHPRFTYSACAPNYLLKTEKGYNNLKKLSRFKIYLSK